MGNALRYRNTHVPRQQGETARLKVVKGPDIGAVYVLRGQRASIGRGDENDVVIADLRASRAHAEVSFAGGAWNVRDLGSVNGIQHNGRQVKSSPIRTGDMVTLGETMFEFMSSGETGTQMLKAPGRPLAQIEADQSGLARQQERVRAAASFGGFSVPSTAPAGAARPAANKRLIIYGALGLAAAFVFLSEDPKPDAGKKKGKKEEEARDLASYLPSAGVALPEETSKTAEMFYRSGFREYREGNFLRARAMFETVLQIAPGHGLAKLYLSNANKAIEDQVKGHLESGRKGHVAGKFKEARGHYEAVLRLLYRDQTNPKFIEAKEQLDKLAQDMKGAG